MIMVLALDSVVFRELLVHKEIPCTVFAVGMALERNRSACKAMVESGWEVASHGYRWWDYADVAEDVERDHIKRAVEVHKTMIGERPVGIYQGKVCCMMQERVFEVAMMNILYR